MSNRAIAEFVDYLNHLEIQLFLETEGHDPLMPYRLRCSAPEGRLTADLRQELTQRKAELIAYLQSTPTVVANPHSQASQPTAFFPLSFAQQRLWFLYQLEPHNPFYNVPAVVRLTGQLDHVAFERSLDTIVRRHAALRTHFTVIEGAPVQVVEAVPKVDITMVNLHAVALPDRPRVSQQLAMTEAQRPFNLTTDSLLRVTLLQFAPTESVLLLTLHHIVADGWSLGVLLQELGCCYTAWGEGRSPTLPALPLQYPDFAIQQRQHLQGDVLAQHLAYWRQQLQDLPELTLPSDRPRPAGQSYRGTIYPLHLPAPLTQELIGLSQASGTSLFMTLLAAFQTLLYRYTGQDDIAIGSPIANRHRSEWEGLIGFFVNTLVLRSQVSSHLTFRELLEQVRQVALAAYEHQDLPFEKLVEELDPDRDLSRNPLFQVAFALQNAPMQPLELPGLTLDPAPFESGSTRFDLEVHLWEPTHGLRHLWQSQEGLSGFISYSTDLFDRDRIGRFIEHFQTLLEGIVQHPDARLPELPILPPEEHQQILNWSQPCPTPLNPQGAASTRTKCFHHHFETHVQATPDAIALVSEQGTLTYQELDQQATQLAQTLGQLGVQPNQLVGLCVDRSADMVIGLLAIWKAGGAYVPFDPNYPGDRLQFMLNDTQVTLLLTQSWLVQRFPQVPAQVLYLDQPECVPFDQGAAQSGCPVSALTPDHLAYVIYTSGSTGTPKGVLLCHRGLGNVVHAQQQLFQPSGHSRVLQFSSLSFDASVFEIVLALGSGGTLYIPPPAAQLPGNALIQFLQDQAITHALLPPAVLAVLPAAVLPDLHVLITGGDVCSSQVLDRWAPNRQFFNAYGPTETTIWATISPLARGDNPRIIGRPIRNTQVYLLDAHLNPVPIGIPGELYIGGVGLAQGYLHRPELTAEKFIANPFAHSRERSPQSFLYKTGDRARFCADGNIEFLGRVDDQVKIRGFRVELGETEAALQRHPAIRAAAVVPAGATPDQMRLLAYFSLDWEHFQTQLPALAADHIQHWQTLYNQTYQSPAPTASTMPQFNISGWNSSYTGEPIPLADMQEWVRDRVQQILALHPKRVLEIGCGTGLLLFQLAPHCQTYVGTDFSTVSLESIQSQLDILELAHVNLHHQQADDFSNLESATFDVVILNSIVQYFPSQDYLLQVIAGALKIVAPQGVLLIGDVRSLPLLPAFHAWVKFCQADATMERHVLRQLVDRAQFEEPELAIAPIFFEQLRDRWPQIQQVHIRLSRGRQVNEMTQFRYNVLLHLQSPQKTAIIATSAPPIGIEQSPSATGSQSVTLSSTHDWAVTPIPPTVVRQWLLEQQPDQLSLLNIPNRRVQAAVKTHYWLTHQAAPSTVGQMRACLQEDSELAIDPQDWWDLETRLPYTVEITWSTHTDTGNYDVRFLRHGMESRAEVMPQQPVQRDQPLTNEPLQANFARQLIPTLRAYLKQTLPDYMIPSAFVPLATLPLSVNGKVDRRALPPLQEDFSPITQPLQSPLGTTEATLMTIWQDLLRLQQITVHDNFFELGGHSLLATQLTSRIRDVFGLELPLKSIFESPTIAQLAPVLKTLRETTTRPQVPPLRPLDRAAFRRPRSSLPTHPPQFPTQPPQIQPDHPVHAPLDPVAPDARSPLVPLTLGHHHPPFFCIHPMFGVVLPYLELAQALASHRSVYGLQPLGLDGKATPLTRMEAIAAYYIQAIQTIQPQGPYFLGGWSFGGLVAFEMAQQLTQAGQTVELLAILDTPAPCRQLNPVQSLKFLLGTALWSALPWLRDYSSLIAHRLPGWNMWFARRQWTAIVRLLPAASRLPLLEESAMRSLLPIVYANSQATYRYVPQPYHHRLTLLKAAEQPDSLKQEPTLGWSTFASQIQVHQVPGNHLSLLQQPHVQTLALILKQWV